MSRMFQRQRPERPEGWTGLDDLLAEQAAAPAAPRSATEDARHQASELLALARREHAGAAAQGASVIQEAAEVAERIRSAAEAEARRTSEKAEAWGRTWSDRVDQLTGELTAQAEETAAHLRAEARRTAVPEAERAARRRVAEESAAGELAAERARAEARDELREALGAGATLHEVLATATGQLADTLTALRDRCAALEQVLADARRTEA